MVILPLAKLVEHYWDGIGEWKAYMNKTSTLLFKKIPTYSKRKMPMIGVSEEELKRDRDILINFISENPYPDYKHDRVYTHYRVPNFHRYFGLRTWQGSCGPEEGCEGGEAEREGHAADFLLAIHGGDVPWGTTEEFPGRKSGFRTSASALAELVDLRALSSSWNLRATSFTCRPFQPKINAGSTVRKDRVLPSTKPSDQRSWQGRQDLD